MSIHSFLLRLAGVLAVVVTLSLLASCGSSSDPAEHFLDQYEEVVDQWDAKAKSGSLSMSDVGDLTLATTDFTQRLNEMQASGSVFTPAQLKRYSELSMRFAKIMAKLGNSPSPITIPGF